MPTTHDPLREWNRLNVSNAERGVARAFFISALSASERIDTYSTWLLAGTAATAALLITGVADILPYLSETGFKWCGALLVASGLLGLLAKERAMHVAIALEQERVTEQVLNPVLERHEEQERQIIASAEKHGVSLETDVDLARTAEVFSSSLPWFLRDKIQESLDKAANDPHSHLRVALRKLLYQTGFTTGQTAFFIGFLVVAVFRVAAV